MSQSILLIEDNEQNRYLATFLLKQSGFKVTQAFDGLTGVELARKILPDLILLDIQLPGMDGYAVASELRAIEYFKTTPIIAVTSYAMVGDREKSLSAGCSGYIEKPINPETFVAEIKNFFQH